MNSPRPAPTAARGWAWIWQRGRPPNTWCPPATGLAQNRPLAWAGAWWAAPWRRALSSLISAWPGRRIWLPSPLNSPIGAGSAWQRSPRFCQGLAHLQPRLREALENPSHPHEYTRVIAGTHWVHGQQAARIR
jgi:hypothetical protein